MKYQLGLSIIYGMLAKIVSVFGNFLLLTFITYYVDPVEQGYYYTFLSLVGIYNVLELGFSVVLRQYIALNCNKLEICNNRLTGDKRSIYNIYSAVKFSFIFYALISLAYICVCFIFKVIIFDKVQDNVQWEVFWNLLVLTSAISFVTLPLVSYLEGIGLVKNVQKLRVITSIFVSILSVILVINKYILAAPSVYFIAYSILVIYYAITCCKYDLLKITQYKGENSDFSWKKQLLPQQSKIAISWLCGFFIFQIVNPVIFKVYGPEVSAIYGFSTTIVNLVLSLGIMYSNLAMPQYCYYLASNKIDEAVELFNDIFRKSLVFVIAISFLGFLITEYCRYDAAIPYLHKIASRVIEEHLFFTLLVTNILRHIVGLHASFIRSINEEKHLLQSVLLAILIGIGVPIVASNYSIDFVIYYQFFIMLFFGLCYSNRIFKTHLKGLYVNNNHSNI